MRNMLVSRFILNGNSKIFTSLRNYSKVNQEVVRVRFAPSPTGFLHLGGLRTALYNYLFARLHNGTFILRIEDTDQTRLVDGAIDQLQRDLEWCGIQIHEGPKTKGPYGPYVQSERLNLYREHVETLLQNGRAYHCFCTERRLELLRKEALRARELPKYDNRCRNLTNQEIQLKLSQNLQSCIRFKLNSGDESFKDLIYGKINYDIGANEGDPVIMKSDGYPTYHFANVVDDHLMEISHVLRGVEWQISTTKHLQIYKAFNWKPPLFGHLPLLMNQDGSKLSKRQGDIKISYYRENGIFPLALINFIVSSGGGFDKDSQQNVKQKCWTVDELIQQYDISRINSHSGRLMSERLADFNRLEIKRKLQNQNERNELIEQMRKIVESQCSNHNSLELTSDHIENILNWSTNRISKLTDLLSEDMKFIWVTPKKVEIPEDEFAYLSEFVQEIKRLELDRVELNKFFKTFSQKHGLKFGKFMARLRSILSGLKEGPSVAEMMEILGKTNTISRLRWSIESKK